MKTIKLSFLIIAIALLTNNISLAQRTIHQDATLTFSGTPYGGEIGTVTGTAVYHFVIQLNKEGYMKRIQWHLTDCDLVNENGDEVKMFDTGFDSIGGLWELFNNPNASNKESNLTYNVADGWMNDIMPTSMPLEGTFNNMNWKFIVNGKVYHWYLLVQFHINANGEITANVVKSAF